LTQITSNQTQKLSQIQIWLLAARPKTLPAAAAPVVAGTGVALFDHQFRFGPALAALLAALLLQIGANIANDVFDFHKGADNEKRLGPLRVTQAGLLTPRQVLTGMWLTFGLAALFGVYLAWSAGWPVILIGLASIAAAIAYTGGPFPLGYHGLGDLFVFIFFGLVAVSGTYYVQANSLSQLAFWTGVPVGLLITAILVVNNLRDLETDRATGKHTMAVRLGERGTRIEYLFCLLGAYLSPLLLWVFKLAPAGVILSWLSIPWAVTLVRVIYSIKGRGLNKALAGTGQLALMYSIFYTLGLVIPLFLH